MASKAPHQKLQDCFSKCGFFAALPNKGLKLFPVGNVQSQ